MSLTEPGVAESIARVAGGVMSGASVGSIWKLFTPTGELNDFTVGETVYVKVPPEDWTGAQLAQAMEVIGEALPLLEPLAAAADGASGREISFADLVNSGPRLRLLLQGYNLIGRVIAMAYRAKDEVYDDDYDIDEHAKRCKGAPARAFGHAVSAFFTFREPSSTADDSPTSSPTTEASDEPAST